jgi:malonate decarboxylase alpha subunit
LSLAGSKAYTASAAKWEWILISPRGPEIFFTGRDGNLRSNRVLCQLAGQYAVDAFVGSTLQMDGDANSSTVTSDSHDRRHSKPA